MDLILCEVNNTQPDYVELQPLLSDIEFYKRRLPPQGESRVVGAPAWSNTTELPTACNDRPTMLAEVPTAPCWVAEGGHWDSG